MRENDDKMGQRNGIARRSKSLEKKRGAKVSLTQTRGVVSRSQ